jgi:ABC-type dipeptide/oligopeptide/nickel transport systems, permease components
LELSIWAILFAILISLPIGTLCAIFHSSYIDHVGRIFSLLGVATPNFWLGPLLIYIFAIQFQILPVSERAHALSFVLPAITLGTSLAAFLSRIVRNSLIEILTEDYITTAHAKGVSQLQILFKHALKNAALPIITVIGLQFGVLLTGTIITEQIFDWPGLGTLMIQALKERDYPLIQGCILFFSLTYLLINIAIDLSYTLLDPRVRSHK